ncbi:DUF6069 family protein [Streptomyces alkaliterrae]|uniref:MFS transporter n=1 Tax=Streptomyces alkaliterrae TaxID=2213162 RepID=A0A5P0YVM7_9ACTN|nr:DUF6069 family protein [Streptomyces alkaliterrae]MBB1255037.1 hypothetical protein [Streptomyces alkaliterrae]MBB1261244.1 hypothetical protein [Streptomyces alkaliterrae]MQS04030.1 hypothetical protein [Streptomyces alkaliterrae]
MASGTARPGIWQSGMRAGLLVVIANYVVLKVAEAVSGGELSVQVGGGDSSLRVGAFVVAVATLVSAVLLILLGLLLRRVMRAPRRLFVALVVLLTGLSVVVPLSSGAPGGTVAALAVMHLLTGVFVGSAVALTLTELDTSVPDRAVD